MLTSGTTKRRFAVVVWYVAMLGLAAFSVIPFWWLVATSLTSGDVFAAAGWRVLIPEHFTLEYYVRLWQMQEHLPMLSFFGNSLLLCSFGVLAEVGLASLAAYPLARFEFRGKWLVYSLLLATLFLPSQANMIVNFVTIRGLGLYDTLLAVLLPSAVSVFGVFLMRQAFLVLPTELEDAARIDGCGEWTLFWKVMMPLTRASQGTLALFSFVSHWNSFMWPLVVLKSAAKYPLSVGLAYMAASFDADFRLLAAASVLTAIPILLVFLLIQKQFIRGITAGAIK